MNTDIRSDDYNLSEDSQIKLWCKYMKEGIQHMGRTLDLDFPGLARQVSEAGFEDVNVKHLKVPIGSWPKDRRLKEAGGMQLLAMLEGTYSLSVAIFCRCLGWSSLEVEIFMAKVNAEFRNRRWHMYWPG